MSKHQNILLIEKFFEYFSSGNLAGIESVLSDDIQWIIPGRHPLAGVKSGIAEVLAYFELLARAGFKAEPKFLEANENCVVDVHRVFSTIGEVSLDGTSVLVWTIKNGKVTEVQNFPGNQHEWDNFFCSLYQLKPLPERLL